MALVNAPVANWRLFIVSACFKSLRSKLHTGMKTHSITVPITADSKHLCAGFLVRAPPSQVKSQRTEQKCFIWHFYTLFNAFMWLAHYKPHFQESFFYFLFFYIYSFAAQIFTWLELVKIHERESHCAFSCVAFKTAFFTWFLRFWLEQIDVLLLYDCKMMCKEEK